MEEQYIKDFETLLKHTDEKEVLYQALAEEIKSNHFSSILDIGAGNGDLSLPLSKLVNRYLAVEQKPKYVDRLKLLGIEVVEGSWPINLGDQELFDLVLSSHSISYHHSKVWPFLTAAWEWVDKNGELLIITFRGEPDDWTDLTAKLGDDLLSYHEPAFADLISGLNKWGEVEVSKIITTVKTDNLEQMLEALAFVYSDGQLERREKFFSYKSVITGLLDQKYKQGNKYIFPFQHFLIKVKKGA